MAQVQLHIEDDTLHLTLRTMLTFAGHAVVELPLRGAIYIVDEPESALALVNQGPVLLLSTASALPETMQAMEHGVWGYILLPLVPGEAAIMVSRAAAQATSTPSTGTHPQPPKTLMEVEREHILDTLRQSKYNRAEAARRLGIGRNTLWRKLKQYDIESK